MLPSSALRSRGATGQGACLPRTCVKESSRLSDTLWTLVQDIVKLAGSKDQDALKLTNGEYTRRDQQSFSKSCNRNGVSALDA